MVQISRVNPLRSRSHSKVLSLCQCAEMTGSAVSQRCSGSLKSSGDKMAALPTVDGRVARRRQLFRTDSKRSNVTAIRNRWTIHHGDSCYLGSPAALCLALGSTQSLLSMRGVLDILTPNLYDGILIDDCGTKR